MGASFFTARVSFAWHVDAGNSTFLMMPAAATIERHCGMALNPTKNPIE
jgi:hypothetical protein